MNLFSLFIELLKKEKLVVDSKVYIYAMGMSQAFFKPNELPVLKQWGRKCTSPPQLETVQLELYVQVWVLIISWWEWVGFSRTV